jgi:hypothetical protein
VELGLEVVAQGFGVLGSSDLDLLLTRLADIIR